MQEQVNETLCEVIVCRYLNRPVEGARPPPCCLVIHLKWSIYWKCFLRPQKTQAGHWLIKANLCSSCVCFRVSASISIALLSTPADWITTLHGIECSAFQHYQEYNIQRMEDVAWEDELASSVQAFVSVILTGGANSTSDLRYYEFWACFIWFLLHHYKSWYHDIKYEENSWDDLNVLLILNVVNQSGHVCCFSFAPNNNNESHSCFKWQFNRINLKYCFFNDV